MSSTKGTRVVGAVAVVVGVVAGIAWGVAPAQATVATQSAPFPTCMANEPEPVLVGSVTGAAFEGLAVDGQGRLYATDLITGNVYRFASPGAAPTVLTTVPTGNGAGGLAFEPDGDLLIGYASSPAQLLGDLLLPGHIERMNLTTGVVTQIAAGLSATDGLAVAADGTIYATNDFGDLVGRVSRRGHVDPDWAHLPSANGAVLSSDGRYLYVDRTFVDPGVSRIPTADPGHPQSLITLSGSAAFDALDGLTLDSRNRPVIPTDISGEILRVDGPGRICHLSDVPTVSSVVAYGHGTTGFSAGRLFRAGFDGRIYEIPAAFDPGGR